MLQQLLQRGLVKRRGDFFRLTVEDLESLDRFARKSAENLHAAIQKVRRRPLERVIASLGIPQVGWTTAIELAHWLAAEVPAGDDWLRPRGGDAARRLPATSPERFQELDGVGPTVSAALATWFAPGGAGRGRARGPRRRGRRGRAPGATCRGGARGRSPARRWS